MSAPDTDVEKQKQRHRPALLGIGGVMLFGGALLVGLIVWVVAQGQEPVEPEVRIDGRTGEEVVVE
jgi:hypothetical protein